LACGRDAEDCIISHWMPVLGGRREPAGWRAPCPACETPRGLSVAVGGRYPKWNIFCPCDRDDVRAKLAELLPDCVTARRRKGTVDAAELAKYALDRSIPELALRVLLLELSGMGITEACDKLGMSRAQRYRTVSQVRQSRRS
jgi:hypothetical protein